MDEFLSKGFGNKMGLVFLSHRAIFSKIFAALLYLKNAFKGASEKSTKGKTASKASASRKEPPLKRGEVKEKRAIPIIDQEKKSVFQRRLDL